MPGTSTIGLRYPVAADNNNVAQDIQNLATDVDGFVQNSYTQAQIDAFGVALKWAGRRVYNSTRGCFQAYLGGVWYDEQGVLFNTLVANYTLVLADANNKVVEMNMAGANTLSVPTDAAVAFPIGTVIPIHQYGAGQTTVAAVTPATTNIRATPGAKLRAQYSMATLFKRAANEWILSGDIVS